MTAEIEKSLRCLDGLFFDMERPRNLGCDEQG
jgi:hypothetical protein